MKNYYVKEQFLKKRQKFMPQSNTAINAVMEQSDKEQYTDKTRKNIAWHGEIRGKSILNFKKSLFLDCLCKHLKTVSVLFIRKAAAIFYQWFVLYGSFSTEVGLYDGKQIVFPFSVVHTTLPLQYFHALCLVTLHEISQ